MVGPLYVQETRSASHEVEAIAMTTLFCCQSAELKAPTQRGRHKES